MNYMIMFTRRAIQVRVILFLRWFKRKLVFVIKYNVYSINPNYSIRLFALIVFNFSL